VEIADSLISPANVAWFNASVPKYRVVRTSPTDTHLDNVNALLDGAGYLDRNGDGYRDTPAGTPFNFTLLTYDEATDPKVAKYSDLITKFGGIGMNVTQQGHTPAGLRAIVASDMFDLFADISDVRGEPSFLYDMLRSGSPRNVVNIASADLDALLDATRDDLAADARRQAVLDVQGWVAEQVPLAPIIHYRAFVPYHRTAFEGWVHTLGGVLNFWTFTALHVPQEGPLTVTVDPYQRTVRSDAWTDVLIRARDQDDNPVAGVDLDLTGTGLASPTGVTDGQGEFTVRFTAPSVTVPQQVPLTVNAAKAGYVGARAFTNVTVSPLLHAFSYTLGKDRATIGSGNSTAVYLAVIDAETAIPVGEVNVTIAISPAGLGASVAQANGVTGVDGTFETTFTGDVTVQSRFVITVTISKAGYQDGEAATTIEVSPRSVGGTVPPTPALDTISMVAVVATLAALYGAWQRRKWVQRKP